MPYRWRDLRCASCRAQLQQVEEEGAAFFRCPACKGAWVETSVFWSVFRHAQPSARVSELMVHNDGTPRRPCPECGATMDIAWINLLQLDQCEQHGIWFDPGELRRALDYEVGLEILSPFCKSRPATEH